jgi:thiamine-phosphate pyrophosphorylase
LKLAKLGRRTHFQAFSVSHWAVEKFARHSLSGTSMNLSLTAGAIRTLELALLLSVQQEKPQIEASQILWSFVIQETRAGELLAAHGLNHETLARLFAPPAGGFDESLISKAANLDINAAWGLPGLLAEQTLVQHVLRAAKNQMTAIFSEHEIGTEHLLFGLLAVDPILALELRRYGLTLELLTEKLAGPALTLAEIETDLEIQYRTTREPENHDTLRILDAAANRAREGLRVLEDYVRFTLDDAHLSKRLKTWRHELSQTLQRIAPHQLLSARETEQDVGTQIRTLTELKRNSVLDVVQANFKRVEEAMRTLEEFGKILSGELGQQLEQLRYGIYTLEKAVLQTQFARERLAKRNLYLLVTEDLCHHGSGPALRGAMQGGVGIVQLREKKLNDRELVLKGRRVREWTREADVLFIMNDRPDLAVLTEADGVHVGQEELTVKDARRIVGADKLVGVSTHTIEQARQAVLDGADYIGVGPVFQTTTKQFDAFAGLEFVKQVAAEIRLPFYAIGGINRDNIDSVIAAGAERVAVSGAICNAADPFEAASELRSRLTF